jgi:outer membrane protein OmpA-like peptidoglycan-associated protein
MKTIKGLITFLLLFITYSISIGQNTSADASGADVKLEEKKLLKSARKEFEYGNYSLATAIYSQLLKLDPTNPVYNFEQGKSLYSNYRQTQSIPFFENEIKFSKDTIGEVYYLLANSYHLSGQFDSARKNYVIYQSMLNSYGTELTEDEEYDLKNEVRRKIEFCDNGKSLQDVPTADRFTINGKKSTFKISNVGKDVNSEYDDYSVVLSENDSVMYFTSRREGTTGGLSDWDDKLFEDIYSTKLGKNGWEKSVNIGAPINTKMHDAVISLSSDGKTIYFYRGNKQGTFYSSTLNGNVWSKPEVLFREASFYTGDSEASFFGYAVAGSELYVVSQSDTGKTGRDIYIAKKKADGSWGQLSNIGAPINTPYDEDAPFITRDGKTMYFSSKGHNSIGGYDIFKSERNGQMWSEPVNLGAPFNSPGEDIYFVLANNKDQAFFSSSSHALDGTKDMDIYEIDLCDDTPQIMLAGTTFGITNGTLSVVEKASSQKVGDFTIQNSKYSIPLRHGVSYLFTLNVPTVFEPVSFNVLTPEMCKVYDLYQEVELLQTAQTLIIKNAFFDIKKETSLENYSEFLSKMDKSSQPLYIEEKVSVSPPTLTLVKEGSVNLAPLNNTVVNNTTTTESGSTTTTLAGTHTVTNSGSVTTIASVDTHTVVTTPGLATANTSSTHTITAVTSAIVATSTASTQTLTSTESTTVNTTTISSSTATSTVTTITVNNILFDYDKSNLRNEFISELDKVVAFLKNANKKAKIEIIGHTDSKGSDEYNLALSKRRANAVATYLASKGVSRNRIIAVGDGESKPIAANENPDGSDNLDGRAKNRRTEIVVTQ